MAESEEGFSGDDIVAADLDRSTLSTGRIKKKNMVDADVLTLARQRVREAYQLFDTVAVSFSGGKDSTVVLNLAIEAAKELKRGPVLTFHFDEEAIPYETEHYVRRVAADPMVDLRWYCLPVQHRNACTRKFPYWYPWAPEDQEKWVRPLPPEAITWDMVPGWPAEIDKRPTMPDAVGLLFDPLVYGRVGMLMGIRASESLTRTRAVLMTTPDSRPWIREWSGGFSRGNLSKVYPVYDWTTADVWTAPKMLGWDYNRAYDNMELIGMGHDAQRCAPPYGEEPMRGLYTFAVCFPDIWDRMSTRVPGAATAARYSRTELYAYGDKPKKPEGMTWPAFIRSWVMKHPEPYRGEIARRIANWVRTHCAKTMDHIAPRAPHPVTGVSWEFLLMIAVRGDYKGRKQAVMAGDVNAAKARYEKEIAATPVMEIKL
jgi:predicted phosphoadenosine phosphosulfate sulfurtransferase